MSMDSWPICDKAEWTTPSGSPPEARPSAQRTRGDTYGAQIEPVRTLPSQHRTAKISTDIDGNVLPVAIVVSPEDLEEMGVAPEDTDVIEYRFNENHLIIRSSD